MSEENGDKRSVTTDALETLGMIIDETQKRDAIHLAVEPVVAGERLSPGNHVKLRGSLAFLAEANCGLGIVDPFLESAVLAGQRFWLVVYPRQIRSLRHVWTHPAFPDNPDVVPRAEAKARSEEWLRNFIDNADCPGYDVVIAAAVGGTRDTGYIRGDYFCFKGRDAHGEIPPEFWDHVEIVTGKQCANRPTYFSCTC